VNPFAPANNSFFGKRAPFVCRSLRAREGRFCLEKTPVAGCAVVLLEPWQERSKKIMQRRHDFLKAAGAAFCVVLIIGISAYALKLVVRSKAADPSASRAAYYYDRFKAPGPSNEELQPDPVVPPEEEEKQPESKPARRVLLEGRVLDRFLSPVHLTLQGAADNRQAVVLKPRGDWFNASFKNVSSLKVGVVERGVWTEPIGLSEPTRLVRFNWIVAEVKDGPIRVQDVACVEIGPALRVFVRGTASLPDGAKVIAALSRGIRRWCAAEVAVKDGFFRGTLEPVEEGYPSGRYTLSVEFNPLSQDWSVLEDEQEPQEEAGGGEESWEEPPPVEPKVRENPWVKWPSARIELAVYVGDPQLEETQRRSELAEYSEICRAGRLLRRSFLALRDLGLAAKGPCYALERRIRRYFHTHPVTVSKDGELDLHQWRFWIDDVFMPRVLALKDRVRVRQVPGAVEIYLLVEAYVNALEKFVKVGSQQVYNAAGLQPDVKDFCAVSLSLEDEEMEVYQKLRRLEERLGRLLAEAQGTGKAGQERIK